MGLKVNLSEQSEFEKDPTAQPWTAEEEIEASKEKMWKDYFQNIAMTTIDDDKWNSTRNKDEAMSDFLDELEDDNWDKLDLFEMEFDTYVKRKSETKLWLDEKMEDQIDDFEIKTLGLEEKAEIKFPTRAQISKLNPNREEFVNQRAGSEKIEAQTEQKEQAKQAAERFADKLAWAQTMKRFGEVMTPAVFNQRKKTRN